jgi:hypothetical protein
MVFDRRAGQLELSARLERDRAAAGHVRKADDVRPVHDRLPAEQMLHADQQRADRALALIGHRIVPSVVNANFSCSVPMRNGFRLGALFEPRDQLVARFEWASGRRRHGPCTEIPAEKGATLHTPREEGNAG